MSDYKKEFEMYMNETTGGEWTEHYSLRDQINLLRMWEFARKFDSTSVVSHEIAQIFEEMKEEERYKVWKSGFDAGRLLQKNLGDHNVATKWRPTHGVHAGGTDDAMGGGGGNASEVDRGGRGGYRDV